MSHGSSHVVLESTGVRAEIDPLLGARLVSLQIAGLEVLGHADGPDIDPMIDEGCYPMVPWAGRIRDGLLEWHGREVRLPLSRDGNALHGLGKDTTWEHMGEGTFTARLGAPWPVEGEATLVYEPRDHGLRITLSWQSDTDGADDPGCSLGIHPWFRRQLARGEPLRDSVKPTTMVERGSDGLPTGRMVTPAPQPWDDCFQLASDPVIEWPGALRLTLSSSTDWWVVYSAPHGAFCLEPQTAPPDVFAHPSLQPHGPWPRKVILELAADVLS